MSELLFTYIHSEYMHQHYTVYICIYTGSHSTQSVLIDIIVSGNHGSRQIFTITKIIIIGKYEFPQITNNYYNNTFMLS